MASAAIAGRISTLEIANDVSPSVVYVAIGEVLDCSLAIERESLDVTSKGSGGNREFIPSFRSATINGSCNWVDADAGQVILLDGLDTGGNAESTPGALKCRFRLKAATGLDEWTADCWVTSCGPGAPVEGQATLDFSLQITGAITRANQA